MSLAKSMVDTGEWEKNNELPFECIMKKKLPSRKIRVQFGDSRTIRGIEIRMPDKESSFVWLHWPKGIPRPVFDEAAEYHAVRVGIQPRRTLCYEHAYKYSGRIHPVEEVTPDDIQRILDITTELYGAHNTKKYGTPMCLANDYRNFYECINEHSDNEDQFGTLNDVICWVVGATRTLKIRDKPHDKKTKGEREIISIELPEGIYIMRGRSFQQHYTHEFPRLYDGWFKKFLSVADEWIGDSDMRFLEKAAWISRHPKRIKNEIKHEKVRGEDFNYDEAFDIWNQRRTSYTIRYFKN